MTCKKCYKKVDGEHLVVPLRDISFMHLNLSMAFMILEEKGHVFSKHEKDVMKKLRKIYAPKIHYWASGQFYDMPEKEYKKFKFKHSSYM